MAKRRTSRAKKSKKVNSFVVFLIVIVVLALISAGVSYYLLDKDGIKTETVNKAEDVLPVKKIPTETVKPDDRIIEKDAGLLSGTWVSNYDGTLLTITGQSCVFEKPAVDSPVKIEGVVLVNKTLVTFIFKEKSSCGTQEGHYEYQLTGESEVFFKRIKDPCSIRSEQMSASWFKL